MILANIYSPDRMVIWSTNPELMGTTIHADDDLDQAFGSRSPVSASYHNVDKGKMEQKFVTPPDYIFIENYIPLFDADGDTVTAMVEIWQGTRRLDRTHGARPGNGLAGPRPVGEGQSTWGCTGSCGGRRFCWPRNKDN